jgi:amidophosphoribosyltransferase
MSDQIKHECGIALIRLLKPISYFKNKYGNLLYGLNSLYVLMEKQHNRGQDGAGIGVVSLDVPAGKEYMFRKRSVDRSPIADIFLNIQKHYKEYQKRYPLMDGPQYREDLPYLGELLLGHLRYGTFGGNAIENVHPFHRPNNYKTRNLMVAGNFNMTNNDELFRYLVELGQYPEKKTDTVTVLEKIGHFLDSENEYIYKKYKDQGLTKKEITPKIVEELSLEYILKKSARDFDGGYAMAGIIGHGDAFVLRDPSGIRPAYFYRDEEKVVVASERPAIRTAFNLPYQDIEEIKPGHALIIRRDGDVGQLMVVEPKERKACSFERIYFSRGTDESIYKERKNLGRNLTKRVLKEIDHDLENSVFSYIPNTSEVAFLGLVEGVHEHIRNEQKELLKDKNNLDPQKLELILSKKVRVEKIALKDTKLRTFITSDNARKDLVAHVYDTTYGVIKTKVDNLVVLDDSIVRGTTLKESIIAILDRLQPKKIVIVSSAPQIRYPDCYGIDMSKIQDFIAFKAARELLREKNKDYILKEVYKKCKEQVNLPIHEIKNYVKEIYKQSTIEEISNKIVELIRPENMQAELSIVYQSIEDLHEAIPDHQGDWYFTGDFPTPGGNKVVNQAFINFYEGKDVRAY